jgi:hypothetical protein
MALIPDVTLSIHSSLDNSQTQVQIQGSTFRRRKKEEQEFIPPPPPF